MTKTSIRQRVVASIKLRGSTGIFTSCIVALPFLVLGGPIGYAIGYSLAAASYAAHPFISRHCYDFSTALKARSLRLSKATAPAATVSWIAGCGLLLASIVTGGLGTGVLAIGFALMFLPQAVGEFRKHGRQLAAQGRNTSSQAERIIYTLPSARHQQTGLDGYGIDGVGTTSNDTQAKRTPTHAVISGRSAHQNTHSLVNSGKSPFGDRDFN